MKVFTSNFIMMIRNIGFCYNTLITAVFKINTVLSISSSARTTNKTKDKNLPKTFSSLEKNVPFLCLIFALVLILLPHF